MAYRISIASHLLVTTLLGALAACGGIADESVPSGDAGGAPDASPVADASAPDVARPDTSVLPVPDAAPDATTPGWTRMTPHDGAILPSMRLVAVYFGQPGQLGAPSATPLMTWLLSSNYWGIMKQYGVGPGSLVASVRLDASAVFPPGAPHADTISAEDLQARIAALLHPDGAASDGGIADGGDVTGDAGDTADAALGSAIPSGDAYIFFLPDNVNVTYPAPDGTTWTTCVEIGGYHGHDGFEPYALMPPCAFGRSAQAISHELAEMATNPLLENGWFSDADLEPAGGEIGDLCNNPITVDGWSVTQLWSNQGGDCEPSF